MYNIVKIFQIVDKTEKKLIFNITFSKKEKSTKREKNERNFY